MKKMRKNDRLIALKDELTFYRKKGIHLSLQGKPCSPHHIIHAYKVSEPASTYMREYIPDNEGFVKAIDFQRVNPPK